MVNSMIRERLRFELAGDVERTFFNSAGRRPASSTSTQYRLPEKPLSESDSGRAAVRNVLCLMVPSTCGTRSGFSL